METSTAKRKKECRRTSQELTAMQTQGESRTDWQRVKNGTDAEVEAAMATDPHSEEIK